MVERQTQLTQEQSSLDPDTRMDDADIEMVTAEAVLGTRRDYRKAVGPVLPKLVRMGADLAEGSRHYTQDQQQPYVDPQQMRTEMDSMRTRLHQSISDAFSELQRLNPGMTINIPDVSSIFGAASQPGPSPSTPMGSQIPGLSQFTPGASSQPTESPPQPAPPSAGRGRGRGRDSRGGTLPVRRGRGRS